MNVDRSYVEHLVEDWCTLFYVHSSRLPSMLRQTVFGVVCHRLSTWRGGGGGVGGWGQREKRSNHCD